MDPSKCLELTAAEKKALNPAIKFKGERICHAAPASFAGASWDVILGLVNNRIYKISALSVSNTSGEMSKLWADVGAALRPSLGLPAAAEANIRQWDTEDGNVIVNRAETGNTHAVVLTLTSRSVSTFERVQ